MNLTGLLTEQPNPSSSHIDALPTGEVLTIINQEDQKVAAAVATQIPRIGEAVDRIVERAVVQGLKLAWPPGQLKELTFLESQIGRAGKMALGPLLGQSRRDIWELQQLAEKTEL